MEDVPIGKHTNIQDNSTAHVDRGSLVMSMSGKIVRSLTKEEIENNKLAAVEYEDIWRTYYKGGEDNSN